MKKTFLSIIFFLFFLLCAYAQSNIGLTPNLKIGYPSVIKGTPDDFSLPKGATSTIKGLILVAIGGDLNYTLNKKLTLQVGVNTSFAKYNQEYLGFTWGTDWDPLTGIVHKSVTINHLNLWQINASLIAKYFATPKISYNLGIVPQITLSQKAISKIEYIDNWKPAINNGTIQYPLKKLNSALYLGLSFYKNLNSTTLLEISPYAQINVMTDDLYLYYTKNRFYQAGLSFNLQKIEIKDTKAKKK